MRRKVLGIICLAVFLASQTAVRCADTGAFAQYFESGQNYMAQGQYSSAITEFRKALRINFMDNSARIGLINSYLSRASYYANQEKNYDKAADDFRNALFYLKLYPTKEQTVQNSTAMIASATDSLNQCLNVLSFDKSPASRYKKAEELRAVGKLAAAAYEFSQAAESSAGAASDSYIQIAGLMQHLGNVPRSADYYKLALDLDPANGDLRMRYARVLDKLGRYEDALPQYNSALENAKGDKEILYSLERIYLKKLAQTPSDAELNANIGAIKQAQGDFETALSYYGKAEKINPSNINTRLNVGTLYQARKDYQKAIKAYDSVLTLYPDNVQANLYKAQALAEMGDKKGALNLYKKVLGLEPANSIAKTESIKLMQENMSPAEYISYLSKNAVNNRSMQDMLYDYALKLHKENNFDDAISAYGAIIQLNPSNADAYINQAVCYAGKNDYANASAVLNRAKSKFPANSLITKTLQEVQQDSLSTALTSASESYQNQDYNSALQKYLSVNPPTEDSLLGAAASYQALQNYDKAIEYYQKAMSIAPKNAQIPYYIGYLYSEQQKWKESEQFLRKSLALNPESEAKSLLNYVVQNLSLTDLNEGISLYEGNKFESALAKFNGVLRNEPSNAYAYYYRGLIYDGLKKTQLAINDYLNVVKYSNELPIANYMLAVDYDSLEKYKEAFKYYNDFINTYTTDDEYLQYAKSRIDELRPYAG